MDDVVGQAAADAVQLEGALVGAVADDGLMLPVLGHPDAEPSVEVGPGGPDGNRHVQHPPPDPGQVDLPADRDILMDHPGSPVVLQLPDRVLDQPPVFHRKLPGQGHLPEPAAAAGLGVYRVPVLHPGDHDPPPVGGKHRLGGVEVQPVVDGLGALPGKAPVRAVLPDEAEGAVAGVELQPHRGHLLRAGVQTCALPISAGW